MKPTKTMVELYERLQVCRSIPCDEMNRRELKAAMKLVGFGYAKRSGLLSGKYLWLTLTAIAPDWWKG